MACLYDRFLAISHKHWMAKNILYLESTHLKRVFRKMRKLMVNIPSHPQLVMHVHIISIINILMSNWYYTLSTLDEMKQLFLALQSQLPFYLACSCIFPVLYKLLLSEDFENVDKCFVVSISLSTMKSCIEWKIVR
jgi:hypothetical protein